MKTAVVKLSEIEESPTLCMSPYRYVGECQKCPIFYRKLLEYHRKYDSHKKVIEELKNLKCAPRFDESWVDAKLYALDLRATAKEIDEELKG